MSLGGLVETARGVEIKDFAFHLAAAAGLALFAAAIAAGQVRVPRDAARQPWLFGQMLVVGWVALSAASCFWSGDANVTLGQAALYAMAVSWALALAWTLTARDIWRLLAAIVVVGALGAGLCVWYYFERNPAHRPGFPLGNPGTLSAAILPAILLAGCIALGELTGLRRTAFATGANGSGSRRFSIPKLFGAIAALVALLMCFVLTQSRASFIGLAVGLAIVAIWLASKRVRRIIVPVMLVAMAGGAWFVYSASVDSAMGRGGSLRLRFYAWRYATELWQERPMTGHGAGAYTRLASERSGHDRVLDPAAFMGDWVEHAHNELFEVLAEIGLVGGVVYVGALLAIIIAAGRLLAAVRGRPEGFLCIGLVASIAAVFADTMFSVGLRLSAVPAVLYTLVGAVWALCRWAAERDAAGGGVAAVLEHLERPKAARLTAARAAAATGVAALSVAAGWLALWNWSGVRMEQRAYAAFDAGGYEQSLAFAQAAEPRLLDPVRRLFMAERVVEARYEIAQAAFAASPFGESPNPSSGTQPSAAPPVASRPTVAETQKLVSLAQAAYFAALELHRRAPTLGRVVIVGARAAEMLAVLLREGDPRQAQEWQQYAEAAWRHERQRSPYDVETLLALLQYPAPPDGYVSYLRDALRSGFPSDEWTAAFRHFASQPGFEAAMARKLLAAGPIDPQTDLNALIASMAPEGYRLSAMWKASRGAFEEAQDDAARAARLYEPMRSRFPTLYSVALAEQAEYALLADPRDAPAGAALLREALARLPRIQEQQYEKMARPFRLRLARQLLAAGSEGEAQEVYEKTLGQSGDANNALVNEYLRLTAGLVRNPKADVTRLRGWLASVLRRQSGNVTAWSWRAWLEAREGGAAAAKSVLNQAAAAGVSNADIERIRRSLCREFPAACAELE